MSLLLVFTLWTTPCKADYKATEQGASSFFRSEKCKPLAKFYSRMA